MPELRTPDGLERTLGGNVTVNINFSTTNITVLSRDQVNQQASYSQPPSMTCGQLDHASIAQQAYPNQQPSNAQVSLPQPAYSDMHSRHSEIARQDLYRRPTTYEAHWQTDTGAMNASYDAAVGSYLGAAASVPFAQQAAAMDGYAKTNAAESARQGAAYAAK